MTVTDKQKANLKPTSQRSKSEVREIGAKGGRASGVARRRKKDIAELTRALMDSDVVDGRKKKELERNYGELEAEDMTHSAAIVAAQMRIAQSSSRDASTRAAQFLTEQYNAGAAKEAREGTFTLDPTLLTVDYLDTYRIVRRRYEAGGIVREFITKGGRATLKSTFWANMAYEILMRDSDAHAVFCRRYKVDLNKSVKAKFEQVVRRIGNIADWKFTQSPMKAVYKPTGQMVMFEGCDDPQSLKSYDVEWGHVALIVFEEADQFAGIEAIKSVETTFLRSDTPSISAKLYNPPKSRNNWINEYTASRVGEPTTHISHSYYYNMPVEWIGSRIFEEAEDDKKNRPEYYRNNWLGEVTGSGGQLFDNVTERTITDEEIEAFEYIYQGVDFGFEHPQVFIAVSYDIETDTVTPVFEKYSRRSRQDTFFKTLRKYKPYETIVDSASPDKKDLMRDMGWDAQGATKRWKGGGRDYSWEWLRSRKNIVIDPERTPKLAKELRTLEFEVMKDGTFSSAYPRLGEDGVMATIYALNRVIIESSYEHAYDDDDIYEEDEEC